MSTSTRSPPRARSRVEFLLFTAGWGANHFSSLLVVYRKELGFSPSALGLLFGAYALGLVPGLVLAGRASDRRGRRAAVLPASGLAMAASLLLGSGGHAFRTLLAGRLLFGLGMGSIMGPGSVWVQELSPAGDGARRATLALSAGFGLGPLVTGVLAEFGPLPMVLPYLVHVVVMGIGLSGVVPVPETVTRAPDGGAFAASQNMRTHSGGPQRAARGLGRREAAVLAAVLPAAPWAFGLATVSLAILPGIMRPHVSRPVLYSAFVIMTTLLAGVLVQPLTARVGRRGDLLGLAVGAVGVGLGAHSVQSHSPALVFAVAALVGGGYGFVMTAGLREVSDRVPAETRGMAVGVYFVLTYVGFALPFVHAIAAKRVGDAAALSVASGIVMACLATRAAIEARMERAEAPSRTESSRS